ncbi:GTP binding protein [Chytridiales sp. JEL 0842]|nr:GTP binding protein [Chytridiales sp. JEL 0842]
MELGRDPNKYETSFMTEKVCGNALPGEVEEGNVEYKLKLVNTPPERFEHLVTQMKWRLAEGHGEAMYEIGVADDGELVGLVRKDLEASVQTLKRMGERLRADVSIIRERPVLGKPRQLKNTYYKKNRLSAVGSSGSSTSLGGLRRSDTKKKDRQQQDLDEGLGAIFLADDDDDENGDEDEALGKKPLTLNNATSSTTLDDEDVDDEDGERFVAEVLVRKCLSDDQHFLEIRVAIVGGADAGKSTLLGVLAHSELDNGRGKSRLNLLRHRHEIETGRTSSISHQIIGFNPQGELINYRSSQITTWEQICETASKVVTFLDMCGHPKYQKTTISGLSGHAPDYACLILGANAGGVSEVSREHLGLSVMLKVPVFVVITKIDVATPEQLSRTITVLLSLLKSPGVKRVPMVIQNEDDLVVAVSSMVSSKVIPIFLTSNVTGENMDLLVKLFNLLPKPVKEDSESASDDVEYCIEETYNVPPVGCVVGGILQSGSITVYSGRPVTYYLGPDRGRFVPIKINSLHRQRIPVNHISSGQAATIGIIFLKESNAEQPTHDANGNGLEAGEDESLTPPPGFRVRKGQVILSTAPSGTLSSTPQRSPVIGLPPLSSQQITASPVPASLSKSVPTRSQAVSTPFSPGPLGQTLVNRTRSGALTSSPVWELYADLTVLNCLSDITAGVQGVLYIGSVRQGARIVKLRDDTGHWAEIVTGSSTTIASPTRSPKQRASSPTSKDELNIVNLVGSPNVDDRTKTSRSKSRKVSGVVITGFDEDCSLSLPAAASASVDTPSSVSKLTESQTTKSSSPVSNQLKSASNVASPSRRSSSPSVVSPVAAGSVNGSDVLPFLKTGSQGRVRLRFAYEPEWVKVGATVIFRGEGKMKCIGKVVSLVDCEPPGSVGVSEDLSMAAGSGSCSFRQQRSKKDDIR